MGYIKTIKEAGELLANRETFNAGTLTANWEHWEGQDPEDPFLTKVSKRYLVRSYGVEIADATENAIHPKAYTHSKTTSKHANIVKKAWGLI